MAIPTFSKSLVVLLMSTVASSSLAALSNPQPNAPKSKSKLLQYPIIPHAEVVRRNRIRNRKLSRHLDQPLQTENRDPEPYYSNATLEVGGLYQGYGTHYVDLWVGSPPQRQTVIVDTGSGVTAFPCTGCHDCGMDYHVDAFFDYTQSTTFLKYDQCGQCNGSRCTGSGDDTYCHLSVSYQEGSMWNAFQAEDVTYVGGPHGAGLTDVNGESTVQNKEGGDGLNGLIHGEDPLSAADFSFNMVFGCQSKITGLFKTQLADGIMGMCLKPSSIFNQMHKQQIISSPSFSLCFARADEAEKDGTIAGALTMGGTDVRLHLKPMVYAHGFVTKGVMHGVKIRKLHLMAAGTYEAADVNPDNTKQINVSGSILNSGSVIVDSGTTDTYMTRSLKAPFMKVFKQVAGFDYIESGMKLSDDQVNKLPTIVVQLEGHQKNVDVARDTPGLAGAIDDENPTDILIVIPPSHYIEYDTDHKKFVGRFSMSEGSGSVLGANTIRGHDVFFDIPESDRIGFAPSDCDYNGLIGDEDDDKEVSVNYKETEEEDDDEDDEDDEDLDDYDYGDGDGDGDDGVGGGDDYAGQVFGNDNAVEDDYYENEDGTSSFSLDKLKNKAKESSVVGIIASIAILGTIITVMVALSKRFRQHRTYSPTVTDLNDLHLDTEIEKLPAIA